MWATYLRKPVVLYMLVCCFLPILDSRFFLVVTMVALVSLIFLSQLPSYLLIFEVVFLVVIIALFPYGNRHVIERLHVNKTKLELLEFRRVFQVNRLLGFKDPRGVFRNPLSTFFYGAF